MIRAASLRGFGALVTGLGGEPSALCARFGIPPEALAADDGLIPITAHDLMLDAAAAELDCPDFGLRLAEGQDLSILGPLAVAIQACSTAGQAIETASRFLFVHSPALRIGIEPDPAGRRGIVAIAYRKDLHTSPYSPQGMELGLALTFRVAVALIGRATGLRSVQFPHQPISPVDRYVRYFGVDARFGRGPGALLVDRRFLDGAFATANEAIRQLALDHLALRYDDPAALESTQVRRVLAELLGAGSPSIAAVGRLLALHPRTLQRRLTAEGTSFETVLDEVRRDAARRLLTTTDLPARQVAAMVGFTEQSTLSHATRRWFGISPRELRRRGIATPPTLSC